jgi:glycosyltransferase involved in cell wall biosynthesis
MNDVIENQIKQFRKHYVEIEEFKAKYIIIKIFLIIILSIFKLSLNSLKFGLSLTKEIKQYQNILKTEPKSKIITIGFYDIIHCDRRWRRVKKGYFYELPKYTNKFRWVFLAKNGVDSNCNKFTHLTFRETKNFENLERAVVENKIDIIVQNEDGDLKQHKYLLELKQKYGTKLVQIMHEYYFYFLIQLGVIDYYNYKWKPLKNFDAIISSVPCQIYMYHLQQLNQSIYLPQHLPFEYREIQPSNLETKNILMIGRIRSEKQFELGIKAMQIIIKKFPDAILKIIGGFNQYTKSLKKLAQDLNVSNNVMFYNSQQDLRPFYNNASLYFMTSSAESFSFVLAESKAYGLANIVTGKEYLVLTKKGSIIVKDNDYKEMAYKTIKLFSNMTYLREQGKYARESLNNFLSEKVDLRYINLYESLMNGTSKEFFDSEYKKYINETESLKDLLTSLELAKTKRPQKFNCFKFEDFMKPFESINLSYCPKK